MAHRQGHGRSAAALLALVVLTGLLPTAGPVRAVDEVGPAEPVELPEEGHLVLGGIGG